MVEFETYKRSNGHDEFVEWIATLPTKDRAKMYQVISDTQEQGLQVAQRMQWVKIIDKKAGIYELRSKVGSNIQRALYFHVSHGRYIITHGFTKKTDTTPKIEIKRSIVIKKEWEKEHED